MLKIIVPSGKLLLATVGNYVFEGPTEVILHRALKLPPNYTDGTPWSGDVIDTESSIKIDSDKEPVETASETTTTIPQAVNMEDIFSNSTPTISEDKIVRKKVVRLPEEDLDV